MQIVISDFFFFFMSAFSAWSYYSAVEQAPASTPSNKVQTNRPCHCCSSRYHCSHITAVVFSRNVKYIEYFWLSLAKQKLVRPQTSRHLKFSAKSVASVPGRSTSTASSEGHKTNTALNLCVISYLSAVTISGRETVYLHFQSVTSSERSTGSFARAAFMTSVLLLDRAYQKIQRFHVLHVPWKQWIFEQR